jgi:hypothetical protein
MMFIPLFTSLIPLLALTCGSAAQTYPATVEFDLVFPRNDTFAPAQLMPLVFAIQNPKATVALPFAIEWYIARVGVGVLFGDTFTPSWANYSTDPDPYFIYTWTPFLNSTEGAFSLLWVLHSGNCSNGLPNGIPVLGGSQTNNVLKFTLKNGAQQQSLVPGPGACPTEYVTFNVTGTMPVEDIVDFSFYNTCAVLAPQPPPGTLCAVKMNDTVASSISAMITASACTTPAVPDGVTAYPILSSGCPTPSGQTSLAVRLNFGGMALSGVAGGSVLSVLILGLVL